MKRVIGLTGGIGAGKSTVAKMFKDYGAYIIDCDKISHEITKPHGVAIDEIEKTFPGTVADGVLDRAALAQIVFSDENLRKELNAITHKYVMDIVDAEIREHDGLIVIDAPLLFEAGAQTRCELVFFVDADENIRKARIMTRDNLTADAAMKRIRAQNTEKNKNMSDVIIDNGTDQMTTKRQLLYEIGERGL